LEIAAKKISRLSQRSNLDSFVNTERGALWRFFVPNFLFHSPEQRLGGFRMYAYIIYFAIIKRIIQAGAN
jgi:hypothetical protein